jgi:hypothetical protein
LPRREFHLPPKICRPVWPALIAISEQIASLNLPSPHNLSPLSPPHPSRHQWGAGAIVAAAPPPDAGCWAGGCWARTPLSTIHHPRSAQGMLPSTIFLPWLGPAALASARDSPLHSRRSTAPASALRPQLRGPVSGVWGRRSRSRLRLCPSPLAARPLGLYSSGACASVRGRQLLRSCAGVQTALI